MQKNKTPHTENQSPLFGRGTGGGSYIEIQIEVPVARITLNRPERHNAIVPELLDELDQVLGEIAGMEELLFVVLSGNGRSFCAGADLHWFSGAEERTLEQNAAQYKHLADVLLKWFQLPQITIAAVRGNVFGGGLGLMSVCDFVLAETNARFMFSEVKLGLLPATILPFVAKRLSVQHLRKWILTGNLFTAQEACQAGLVDLVCEHGGLEIALAEFLVSFEAASPSAVKKAKHVINQVVSGSIDVDDTAVTSTILAQTLLSPDGQEGIHAFLEKRKPEWKQAQSPTKCPQRGDFGI
jgi:methylglutaconyl-CoA hydratase